MKVLITAGGTSESIDSVRSITNHSTGRLGSIIADKFAHKNANVTYVYGEKAALPSHKNIEIVPVKNVQGLQETFGSLFERDKYDCVIHSMAVSDFTPQAVITFDDIVKSLSGVDTQNIAPDELAQKIRNTVLASTKPLTGGKIYSKQTDLMVLLKQTPKVIKQVKTQQPETILVGFKLLVGVPECELVQTAKEFLTQNNCDFVLANDLHKINNDSHKAILIDKNGNMQRANTKQEIATAIYNAVYERINR